MRAKFTASVALTYETEDRVVGARHRVPLISLRAVISPCGKLRVSRLRNLTVTRNLHDDSIVSRLPLWYSKAKIIFFIIIFCYLQFVIFPCLHFVTFIQFIRRRGYRIFRSPINIREQIQSKSLTRFHLKR